MNANTSRQAVAVLLAIGCMAMSCAVSAEQAPIAWPSGAQYDPARQVLHVSGELTRRLADAVAALDRGGGEIGILVIDRPGSPGGDVDAAMRIGRVLRRQATPVSLQAPCASACVLMIAGGVRRAILTDGDDRLVGLHRPFSTTPSASFQAEQSRVSAYSARIRGYLTEMNIGPDLFEAMIRVPPEDIRWVNAANLAGLGMPEWDPVYAEYRAGKAAADLGISREELNRRMHLREVQCDPLNGSSGTQYCECVVRVGLLPPGTACDATGSPGRSNR